MTIKQGWIQLLMISSVLMLSTTSTRAQITPDNTLETEGSRLTPNVEIQGASADRIDGGAQRGANLFHSFSKFNVGDGQRVYFTNPSGIQNILTRVTGKEASNILGTLGVDGIANLFLLNPNGIIFGPNARLDVGGSFVGTTANAIGFGKQGFFSATTPEAPTLLTVNPSALLFNQLNQGSIVSRSLMPAGRSPKGRDLFGLRVPDGQNLMLVGGDVRIGGGGSSEGGLIAQGGRIELGGLFSTGEIGLDTTGNSFQLTYPNDVARSNVSLINNARVSVRGNGGGDVAVNANAFTATNGGRLVAGTEGKGNVGDITVNANTVNLAGTASDGRITGLSNIVLESATGNAGNITVNTNSLKASSGARIISSTFGRGNAGNVIINARDTVALEDAVIISDVQKDAIGQAGNIQITARSLFLTDSGILSSTTGGQGNAGNIDIQATDQVVLDSGSNNLITGIGSAVSTDGVGRGGDIQITTGSLSLANNAVLIAGTAGQGDSGNVIINAPDRVSFSRGGELLTSTSGQGNAGNVTIRTGDLSIDSVNPVDNRRSGIFSTVDGKGVGRAGNIDIAADSLAVTNGGIISAVTSGKGRAGDITIKAGDRISLSGTSPDGQIHSGISTETENTSTSDAGNISLDTERLSLSDGAYVLANTFGQGQAGDITIHAGDRVSLSGVSADGRSRSAVSTQTAQDSTGNAGNITLDTGQLDIRDGAGIFTTTAGKGRGGNIQITAQDKIKVSGRATLANNQTVGTTVSSATSGQGKAGNITITTPDFQVANGGIVLASTSNDSRAGDITLNTQTFTATTGGQVVTNTLGAGDAGTIRLNVSDSITLSGSDPNFANRGDRAQSYITRQEQGATSGLFANTAAGSTGNGGSIIIDPHTFRIQDGARISVGSLGSGQGGSIQVQAGSLLLNRGQISAETASTNGGDITLQVEQTLLLRNSSLISTTAGTERAGGNGGNITINANNGFLVAFPSKNSDISANAYSGNGGNVQINAQGIFGIQARPQLTFQSDITASSELGGIQGQVAIIQPDVQPTQGLIELPTDVLDASSQIAQVCPRGIANRPLGKFIVSGRGSLPPNPIEPLASTSNLSPLATLEGNSAARLPRDDRSSTSNSSLLVSPPAQIVEATGWIKTPDGKIELVAYVPEATPYAATTAACPVTEQGEKL